MSPGRWFGQCPAAGDVNVNRIDVDGAQVHGFAEMHEVGLRNQRADREAEVEQALVVARQKAPLL